MSMAFQVSMKREMSIREHMRSESVCQVADRDVCVEVGVFCMCFAKKTIRVIIYVIIYRGETQCVWVKVSIQFVP